MAWTNHLRLELKALQEQISALAPKVDGLVAKEGTGDDIQARMELTLRELLCGSAGRRAPDAQEGEGARGRGRAVDGRAAPRDEGVHDRDRKERRRERKRDDHNALKEKVNEVLLRQQIGGGTRPVLSRWCELEELQANLEQPMIDLPPRLDALSTDVKSLKNGTPKKQGELSAYREAVASWRRRRRRRRPTTRLIHACARSRRRSASCGRRM